LASASVLARKVYVYALVIRRAFIAAVPRAEVSPGLAASLRRQFFIYAAHVNCNGGHVVPATGDGVGGATARALAGRAPLDGARRKLPAFDGLFEYARDLLGERAMVSLCALAQRLLEIVGHFNESFFASFFAVCHSVGVSPDI
jgi:hypothetical protein